MKNKLYILEIEQNAEGSKLAYLSPTDKDGKMKSGFRIAGPKAWGGSRTLAKLKLDSNDLLRFMNNYAPEVLKELKKEAINKLKKIASIIDDVDNRCLAADGAVTRTLEEMTQEEISKIYNLATKRSK